MIVGDGIRESTEVLTNYLSSTPQLHFTIALVELKLYQTDKGLLVVPQIVARTREITRAIIRIEGNQPGRISIDTDVGPPDRHDSSKRYKLSEQDFLKDYPRMPARMRLISHRT